ncbi:MAG: outer-membrane lipoprotein carrier protein LolA [Elusimicrobia bacterium]|nr:outer-membrane lipoprotein carrier protein LolA [Elusimicrobiota bacterium]
MVKRLLFAVLCVIFASVNCFAQKEVKKPRPKTQKTSVKKPAAAKKEKKSSFEQEVIKKLTDWDSKLSSLSCDFTQTIIYGDTGIKTTSKGSAHYVKSPVNFRIEHKSPKNQIIYTDKKNIWIYQPKVQAIRTSWEDWLKQNSTALNGLADFGSYSALISKHKTKVERKSDKEVLLILTPKDNPTAYTFVVTLSTTDYFPVSAKLDVEKVSIITTLENTEKNAKIPMDIFKFTPPDDIALMDLVVADK